MTLRNLLCRPSACRNWMVVLFAVAAATLLLAGQARADCNYDGWCDEYYDDACCSDCSSCGDGVCKGDCGEGMDNCPVDCCQDAANNGVCEPQCGEDRCNASDCGGPVVNGDGQCWGDCGETIRSAQPDCCNHEYDDQCFFGPNAQQDCEAACCFGCYYRAWACGGPGAYKCY